MFSTTYWRHELCLCCLFICWCIFTKCAFDAAAVTCCEGGPELHNLCICVLCILFEFVQLWLCICVKFALMLLLWLVVREVQSRVKWEAGLKDHISALAQVWGREKTTIGLSIGERTDQILQQKFREQISVFNKDVWGRVYAPTCEHSCATCVFLFLCCAHLCPMEH